MECCVKNSFLWPLFRKFSLKDNLRLCDANGWFQNWLLEVGENKNCTKFERDNEVEKIPNELLSKGDLLTEIFGVHITLDDPYVQSTVSITKK